MLSGRMPACPQAVCDEAGPACVKATVIVLLYTLSVSRSMHWVFARHSEAAKRVGRAGPRRPAARPTSQRTEVRYDLQQLQNLQVAADKSM